MPMKLCLEFMAIVCLGCMDTEGKLCNDMVDELDSVFLGMSFVDFKGPNAGCIVNSRILKNASRSFYQGW